MVIIEAILASLSQNDLINLSVISVSDWLIRQQIDDTRLIGYLQSLLDEGCLMSITKDVIDYMSLEASKKDSDSKQRMYLMWDDLLGKLITSQINKRLYSFKPCRRYLLYLRMRQETLIKAFFIY